MAWLSPSYPIGAFSYSGGVEWAVAVGDITEAATLRLWLAAVNAEGGGFSNAVFLVHAHRAAAAGDDAALHTVAELAAAFAPSKGAALETTAQGRAFLDVIRAVGVAGAGHGIALTGVLHAYLHAPATNSVSAGVRLVPLGQTDGQRVLARTSRWCGRPPCARSRPGSTMSAARPSELISRACGTRPSTRGCLEAETLHRHLSTMRRVLFG